MGEINSCAVAPDRFHALDETEPRQPRTIGHVARHSGDQNEDLRRVAEGEVAERPRRKRIIGNVIDKNNDQSHPPTEVEPAVAFPFLVHPDLVARLLRARCFFTCSALVLEPAKKLCERLCYWSSMSIEQCPYRFA